MFSERRTEQLLAITYGLLCHSLFLMAGMIMFWTLLNGFVVAQGTVSYPLAIIFNLILLLQFPAGHSFFLSEHGHRFLRWFAPKKYWQTLSTTTYTSIASFQLLLLFYFWSPSGVIIYHYQWPWNIIHLIFFSLIPFIIVNGILTGYLDFNNPPVWYNNAEIIGLRFLTIPVEDFLYNFVLMYINYMLFEFYCRRKQKDTTK